jgi:AcrR family transcriptional regulator
VAARKLPRAKKPKTRRTQEERREATTRKLLDAAADSLIEDGYANASVQAICVRAGVSQGGLFRHFASRDALMVAAAGDIATRILEQYGREFESLRAHEDPLVLAMRLVRRACRSRLNQAWYELAMAARTHPGLRKALRPMSARYYADIEALARQLLPELASAFGDRFSVLVDTIIAVFDGEVVHRLLLEKPDVEDARIELLASLARSVLPRQG